MVHVALALPFEAQLPEDLGHLAEPSCLTLLEYWESTGIRMSGPALECWMSLRWSDVTSGKSPQGILHGWQLWPWSELTSVPQLQALIQTGHCGSCSPSLSQDPGLDLAGWPWRLAGNLSHYSSSKLLRVVSKSEPDVSAYVIANFTLFPPNQWE